ncbi:hypothetical protein A3Q56_03655 [Intoshia linei]|uniref:3'(2'),5'-bisphosphate nucleotidase 1 n=1 Tax=Intoshia linei TaxID=1819745 RepID=A0A177B2X3_9BILA|nr:hypothetical protein A3Q56_03655 [Intoshia linei]
MLPLLTRLVANCYDVAIEAGKIIKSIHSSGDLSIFEKNPHDFVTAADLKAQVLIVSSLKHNFPNVKIIAEEDNTKGHNVQLIDVDPITSLSEEVIKKCAMLPAEYNETKEKEFVIWVDPLDGTYEFTKGKSEHVTVLIGISRFGVPIAGIIGKPFSGKCGHIIWGVVKLGVIHLMLINIRIGAFGLNINDLKPGRIITTAKYGNSSDNDKAISACLASEIMPMGGAGFKTLNVIEKNVHAYITVDVYLKKWDTCAPEAIILSCGGLLSDKKGNIYKYTSDSGDRIDKGLVATMDHQLHNELVDIISKIQKNEKTEISTFSVYVNGANSIKNKKTPQPCKITKKHYSTETYTKHKRSTWDAQSINTFNHCDSSGYSSFRVLTQIDLASEKYESDFESYVSDQSIETISNFQNFSNLKFFSDFEPYKEIKCSNLQKLNLNFKDSLDNLNDIKY